MNRAPRLVSIEQSPELVIDITLAMRADIKARDWRAVHVAGDRSPPLDFFRKVIRTWRA